MPPRRLRLDAELVRRGLARSRDHASELIAAGRVSVNKAVATKPATQVDPAAPIVLTGVTQADSPDETSTSPASTNPAPVSTAPARRSSRPRRTTTAATSAQLR